MAANHALSFSEQAELFFFGVSSFRAFVILRFTLDELLAQCDPKAPPCEEDREWLGGGHAGRELI